jgi:hypothetical protein
MMDEPLTKVLLDRERLLARIEQQRSSIKVSLDGLSGPIGIIDQAMAAGRFLRTHPLAAGGLVALMVVLSRHTLFGTLTRGIGAWRLVRQVQHMLRRIRLLRMAGYAQALFRRIFR